MNSETEVRITKAGDAIVDPHEWGRLEWAVAGDMGNSEVLTVGRCYINPGQQNPRHHHPNCDEVLQVLQGSIEHSVGSVRFVMEPGDTVSIPRGAVHNARNIGSTEAILLIAFDTAEREAIGE